MQLESIRKGEWRERHVWYYMLALCAFGLPLLAVSAGSTFVGLVDTGIFIIFIIPCCLLGWRPHWDKVSLCCLLFLITMGISLLWNIYIDNADIKNLFLYIRLWLIFSVIIGAWFLAHQSSSRFRNIIKILLVGIFISLMYGCWSFFNNKAIQPNQQVMWYADGGSHIRAGGLIGNTGTYGHQVFMFYTLGMLLWLTSAKSVVRSAVLFTGIMAASLFFITISSSRGAFIGIVLFTVLMIPVIWKRRRKSMLPIAVIGGALFIALSAVSLNHSVINYSLDRFWISHLLPQHHSHATMQREGESNEEGKEGTQIADSSEAQEMPPSVEWNKVSSGRLDQWTAYLDIASRHPWLGVGYKNADKKFHLLMDNSVVSVMVEGGIVALIPFLMMWGAMLIGAVDIWQRSNRLMGYFLGVLMVSTFLQSLLVDIYTQWYSFPIFLFLFMGVYYKERFLRDSSWSYNDS